MKSSTPSYSNKTPFLDTQASLSCACKTRCNSAKYCCCKKNKLSCSARCHPGHSCTNGDHTKPLCKMDLTAELSGEDEDTWVTICTAQLTKYHKAILASPKSWLDDLIITAAQLIPPQEQFVQIINVNKNHWIALFNVGCQKACIKIFDCNGDKELPKPTLKLISALLQTQENQFSVEFVDVQLQEGSHDCGFFCSGVHHFHL